MKCERCEVEEATVVVTTVVDDSKTTRHLCHGCAVETGIEIESDTPAVKEDSINMLDTDGAREEREVELRCPNCGLTYSQFKERYRVGCAECYDAFRERMEPLLRKVHSSDTHTGKRPGGEPKAEPAQQNSVWTVEVLRRRLQAAVTREEFEEAARLRDQIDDLEQTSAESEERS